MSEQLMTQALQEMLMHVFTNPYPEQKWKGWLALEQTFGVPVEFNLITNVRLSAACKELRTYEGVKEAIYKMMESEPDYITFVKLRKFKSAWPVYVDKLSSVVRQPAGAIHKFLESNLISVVVELLGDDERYGYGRSNEVIALVCKKLEGTHSMGDRAFNMALRRDYEAAIDFMHGQPNLKMLLRAVYHYHHRNERLSPGCLFRDGLAP